VGRGGQRRLPGTFSGWWRGLVDDGGPADPEHGLTAVTAAPYWAQETWARRPPASLLGLRPDTRAADVRQALLEAHAFAVRGNVEDLERALGRRASAVVVCGGAAADGALPRLLADVLGREVHWADDGGAARAGSALVARAVGAHAHVPGLPDRVLPGGDAARHDDAYAAWCRAHEVLRTGLGADAVTARALVTAEWTPDGSRRLEALGYSVTHAGWGVTRQALGREALVDAARRAELLVVEVEVLDAAVLAALPELRLVATARGGPVNVDLAACAARGVPVLFTPARNADSVADFVLGLLISLVRGIGASELHLRATGWHVDGEVPYLHFRGPELAGRTLGLVGHGAIGRRVAQRARDGFGMHVLFHDPYADGSTDLDELLARSDVVSLHCPRSPETRGLIGAAALARMQPTAYLLNTAGGGIVDEDALVQALVQGRLAGAALDVFATEPLPRDSPLLRAPRLLLTPHLAGAALDVVRHHTDLICADVERWHRGEPLVHAAGR
jgi:phosphoglycerate dehydrogenase-like enzyme